MLSPLSPSKGSAIFFSSGWENIHKVCRQPHAPLIPSPEPRRTTKSTTQDPPHEAPALPPLSSTRPRRRAGRAPDLRQPHRRARLLHHAAPSRGVARRRARRRCGDSGRVAAHTRLAGIGRAIPRVRNAVASLARPRPMSESRPFRPQPFHHDRFIMTVSS